MIKMIWVGATLAAVLIMPVIARGEIIWHAFSLHGRLRLSFGPAPFLWVRAVAALEPLTLKATVNGIPLRRRPRKKKEQTGEKPKRSPAKGILSSAIRCRRLRIGFDLGVAQNAAATAIGYGTLSALTNMTLAWAQGHGATGCSGSVRAHFDEPRYDGIVEGIFQTSLAHIMLSAVKAWRNR